MSTAKRKWDRISDEKRKEVIDQLILYFKNERDESIGVVAAEQLLNFFLESTGGEIYNKGLEDAKSALEKRLEEYRYDIDELTEW